VSTSYRVIHPSSPELGEILVVLEADGVLRNETVKDAGIGARLAENAADAKRVNDTLKAEIERLTSEATAQVASIADARKPIEEEAFAKAEQQIEARRVALEKAKAEPVTRD